MSRRVDVAVVGAGPAGAATAALLAARGRSVLVLDRASFPRPKLCGDYVHPAGAALLDRLGVLRTVARHGQTVRAFAIVSPQGRRVVAPFPNGAGLSVPRDVLDGVLAHAAAEAGAEVETGRTVRGVSRAGTRWRLHTDAGEVQARVVVGADGLRSLVGRATGLRNGDPRHGRFAVGLYVDGFPSPPGLAEMHLGLAGAYCGVSSFGDGRANVTCVVPQALLRAWRGRVAQAAQAFARDFPHLAARLDGARSVEAVRTTGPLAPATGRVVGDGVVLVGDAATFTDPLTGQGVTHGLAGGFAAADAIEAALDQGDVRAACLAPYARWHRERFSVLRPFLRLVDAIARRPALLEPLARVWERHPELATDFLSVIGCGAPVTRVVQARYLWRLLRAA